MTTKPKRLRELIQSRYSQRKWSRGVKERDEHRCALEVRRGQGAWKICGSKGLPGRGFQSGVFACHIIKRAESGVAAFTLINGITGCYNHHSIYDHNTIGEQTEEVRVPPERYERAFRAVCFATKERPKRRQ